eukprot:1160117-Pelagomonas_calceolata.AAC.9
MGEAVHPFTSTCQTYHLFLQCLLYLCEAGFEAACHITSTCHTYPSASAVPALPVRGWGRGCLPYLYEAVGEAACHISEDGSSRGPRKVPRQQVLHWGEAGIFARWKGSHLRMLALPAGFGVSTTLSGTTTFQLGVQTLAFAVHKHKLCSHKQLCCPACALGA